MGADNWLAVRMFTHSSILGHASLVRASVVVLFLVVPTQAHACPDCPTARFVRASVFDDHFGTHLMLISMPLIVLAVISALLYRIGLERPRSPGTNNIEVNT
jgi:hypothetical protein